MAGFIVLMNRFHRPPEAWMMAVSALAGIVWSAWMLRGSVRVWMMFIGLLAVPVGLFWFILVFIAQVYGDGP